MRLKLKNSLYEKKFLDPSDKYEAKVLLPTNLPLLPNFPTRGNLFTGFVVLPISDLGKGV
jgi:hypothetical protein